MSWTSSQRAAWFITDWFLVVCFGWIRSMGSALFNIALGLTVTALVEVYRAQLLNVLEEVLE
jgi:hypothetical protein